MDNRVVTASFTDGEVSCVTLPVYQYNYGNELHISGVALPSTFEAHFANDQFGDSTTQIGTDGVVTIPDIYLTNSGDLYCWIFLHDTENDGETEYKILIPITARARITNSTPTPVQQDVITEAIAALNAAVTYCDDAVDDCEAAVEHYPKIEEGNWYVWDVESGTWSDTGTQAQGEPGAPGADGKDGKDGVDGHTPVITASKSGKITTVYVDGTAVATISDGEDGQNGADGADGADGYSPTATVTKSGDTATISITDKNGTTTATISDGDPSALIDDSNVSANSTFSSSKIQTLLIADISNEVFGV